MCCARVCCLVLWASDLLSQVSRPDDHDAPSGTVVQRNRRPSAGAAIAAEELAHEAMLSGASMAREVDTEGVLHLQSLFRFLQVLCEGHFAPIQNFLRDRRHGSSARTPGAAVEYNIVALCCQVLEDLHLRFCAELVSLTLQVLDTITELVQGPCLANQLAIVNLKFVEVIGKFLNNPLHSYVHIGVRLGEAKLLHYKCVLAAVSLFEGRTVSGRKRTYRAVPMPVVVLMLVPSVATGFQGAPPRCQLGGSAYFEEHPHWRVRGAATTSRPPVRGGCLPAEIRLPQRAHLEERVRARGRRGPGERRHATAAWGC